MKILNANENRKVKYSQNYDTDIVNVNLVDNEIQRRVTHNYNTRSNLTQKRTDQTNTITVNENGINIEALTSNNKETTPGIETNEESCVYSHRRKPC